MNDTVINSFISLVQQDLRWNWGLCSAVWYLSDHKIFFDEFRLRRIYRSLQSLALGNNCTEESPHCFRHFKQSNRHHCNVCLMSRNRFGIKNNPKHWACFKSTQNKGMKKKAPQIIKGIWNIVSIQGGVLELLAQVDKNPSLILALGKMRGEDH